MVMMLSITAQYKSPACSPLATQFHIQAERLPRKQQFFCCTTQPVRFLSMERKNEVWCGKVMTV